MDLSLVETELLIKTLLERYEHAIFMGVNIPRENKDNIGEKLKWILKKILKKEN